MALRLIISDSSCLIDLKKVDLLLALMHLPFEIAIPDVMFADELLSITESEKQALVEAGLVVLDLPGDGVERARTMANSTRLTMNDRFALVLAERHTGCILLTGDGALRKMADESSIEVHGVLWVIDRLAEHAVASTETLLRALQQFHDDPTVRLPGPEVRAAIKRHGG